MWNDWVGGIKIKLEVNQCGKCDDKDCSGLHSALPLEILKSFADSISLSSLVSFSDDAFHERIVSEALVVLLACGSKESE